MSLNRASIIGNVGADPELKTTANDTICTFSVATNEFYKSGTDSKPHTEWHQVVVFGKLAQTCSLYLKKGSRTFLESRIRTSSYQDKEGKQQSRTRIYASTVQFLDSQKPSSDLSHILSVVGDEESLSESSNLELA